MFSFSSTYYGRIPGFVGVQQRINDKIRYLVNSSISYIGSNWYSILFQSPTCSCRCM